MTKSVIKVTEFRSIRSMMMQARERAMLGMNAEEVSCGLVEKSQNA